jgi:predicted metal-dependent hydrolase
VSGETHYYLGRQYRLKVIQDDIEAVKLIGRFIRVYVRDRDNTDRIKGLVERWYLDHAKVIFEKRLKKCLDGAKSLNIHDPNVIIRRLAKRWGSCTKAENIVLNTDLIKTPLYCIEYVIMHELCHLRVPKHNQHFYRLLSRHMSDWERRKSRLDGFIL